MPEPRTNRYPEPRLGGADEPEPTRPRPAWQMIAVIVVAALVLTVIVIAHLTGAIGPGVHQSAGS